MYIFEKKTPTSSIRAFLYRDNLVYLYRDNFSINSSRQLLCVNAFALFKYCHNYIKRILLTIDNVI